MRKRSFYITMHQNKDAPYARALVNSGRWNMHVSISRCDAVLMDHDLGRNGKTLEWFRRQRIPIFMYPHGARSIIVWDGIHKPFPVTGCFVIGPGQAEVMRRYGYPHRVIVSGWPWCEMKPFQPFYGRVRNVLFGPVHPNRNGKLYEGDRELNRRTFETLLTVPDIRLTVRYLRGLECNGLYKVPGVRFIEGKPDGSHREIDAADVVVAHETMAYIAIARGKPTAMFGEDVVPHNGNAGDSTRYVANWEKYQDILRFPLDILDGDPEEVLDRACYSDEEIAGWKANFIGQPFNEAEFVRQMERLL